MKKENLLTLIFSGFIACGFAQAPVADFSGTPRTICAGQSVAWTNLTTGGVTYAWSFPGATAPTSGATNPAARTYTASGVYDVTLAATNANGTDTMRKAGYITVIASPTIVVTPSPGYICTGGSVTLTATGANTYSWTPATGLNTTTGSTVISTLNATTTYTVSGTNANGCISRTNVLVYVNTNPPPTPGGITGSTAVCSGQTGVTYSVPNGGAPAGTIRTWSVPAGATVTSGQGTRNITVTFGSTSGNVCVTSSNGCGTSAASCLAVAVNPTPAVGTVGTITGPTEACANQTGVTYSVASVANATSYNWTTAGGAAITAGQGTATITVDFTNANDNICVDASNACNTSAQSCQAITVVPNAPAIPGGITGLTTVCNGQTGVAYSVANVPNASVYTWTVPSGASVAAGQGTRFATVDFGATSGTVCVTAGNACGTSLASCQTISVDPNPALGTIGTISGPSAACANQTGVIYSVASVANATSYNWTVPTGASITAGQGTSTITVTFGITAGNICVDASNSCSTSSQSCQAISISPSAPAIPGGITGLTTVCNGQTGVSYSVASVPNTSVYTWTVPSGASVAAGQGTRFATVNFGATSGTVCVTASNACGTSLASCQTVSVDPNPAVGTVGTITGPTAVCANQTNITYSIVSVTGASTYSWTVPGGASATAGQGTNTVTVSFGTTAGNICVTASNSCSTSAQSCQAISVAPNAPAIPGGITGLTTVCNGQTGVAYSVVNVPNTSVYTWTVPSGASVAAGQGTRFATVDFGAVSGTVCVTAGNACGTSLGSCQSITVDPTPALGTIGTISGPSAVCANQTGVTYSIPSVANAASYNWTVPGTATVTAGQGTAAITVNFGTTSGNIGNICVDASNSCSTSSQSCQAISVSSSTPAIPTGITGATTVCSGQVGNYSIASVARATSYAWTVPSGGSVTSGQGTTAVTITFGNTSGNICVSAGNACGTSLASCQAIAVSASALSVMATPTSTTCFACCDGSATATPSGGSAPYTYSWLPGGQTTQNISGICPGTYSVCVTDAGGCVTCANVIIIDPQGVAALTDNGTLKVFPNPANDYIFIEGTLSSSANLQVNIINVFGQKVMDKSLYANGSFSEKISIGNIAPGVYFIEIRSGEMLRNSKIVKVQ
ncbi:MAG: T9SS type A sorting domain-containing protein [Bacteroidetes bacterium]|nr:T9SS type A sorting domain-containing protein [Bacteroidota bacterium]